MTQLSTTNQYVSQLIHQVEAPPPMQARFFYASPMPIDDPLSPLPPPNPNPDAPAREPPKPFSEYDNHALDKAWKDLRQKIFKFNEERGEKESIRAPSRTRADSTSKKPQRRGSASRPDTPRTRALRPQPSSLSHVDNGNEDLERSIESLEPVLTDLPDTTGTPFIRAPSRSKLHTVPKDARKSRPKVKAYDTYLWEDPSHLVEHSPAPRSRDQDQGPTVNVAVGIARLHHVEMPELKMTPIYWTPVNDTAQVMRGTWFYKDNMLPVETSVAIMLEAGYIDLQAWTETWRDELNSAVEVGAAGEMKIVHKLWPEKAVAASNARRDSNPRPSTANRDGLLRTAVSNLADLSEETPGRRKEIAVEAASDILDIATGPEGPDSKAAGRNAWGQQGSARTYQHCGVIYVDAREARILKPNLLPSSYYGRRPLANYIRKGRSLGITVVRGFDQAVWNKLHPTKSTAKARKAQAGVAVSASGVSTEARRKDDPDLAQAQRPEVTDLVLVIHGIGQQLSKRMFNFHFTHAISSFRREINIEVGSNECKAHFRKDMGSIMALPVNWRHDLSFEDGGYRDDDHAHDNNFSLADITPDGLTYVRNIVSDVMLDVPYYLSHHQQKMLSAVVREANRVYRLWCVNNPGFAEKGRVHLIGHSLGSVMSVEILSKQPTQLPAALKDPTSLSQEAVASMDHFLFNTSNLFLAGSPVGFFLLLNNSQLLPRIDSTSAAAQEDPGALTPDVAGRQGQYGCIAVENVYNLVNGYDPVATCMNATVDAAYAGLLKKAWVPSAMSGWFGGGLWSGSSATASNNATATPKISRLPSQVELETHNFSREEIAEKRMRLLNDNLQIDYFLRYGGGPLDIQYISMLSAHASYWLLKDFVRMIVVEVGRPEGQAGTLSSMRAVKGKTA